MKSKLLSLFNMRLTDFLINAHVILFMLPWQPRKYIPGPVDTWVFLFLLLFGAFIFEAWRDKRLLSPSRTLNIAVIWFIIINIVGLFQGLVLETNPVRRHIPLLIQVSRAMLYADGFLVLYLIKLNSWGIKEFERFFKIILIPGVIISIECLLVYYLELPLGFNKYSMWPYEGAKWFLSVFYQVTTPAGPMGLITVGLSMYFWITQRQKRYLVFSILGVGLVIANVTLLAYLGLFFGIILGSALYLLRKFDEIQNWFVKFGVAVLLTATIVAGLFWGTQYRATMTKLDVLIPKVLNRSYQYARSLDVLANYPVLGGGGGIGFYYAYSKYTQPVVTGRLEHIIPKRHLGLNWAMEDPYNDGDTYSIHSVFANVWADLGLLGLIIVFYLFFNWSKIFLGLSLNVKKEKQETLFLQTAVILGLIAALYIFIAGKPKFYPYWFFSILVAFCNYLYSKKSS